MAEHPEADLRFAGSEELAQGGNESVDDILGTTNAAWWVVSGTDASIDEVHAFYDAELSERGWEPGSRVRTSDEIERYSWTRDGLRFRLGFKETDEAYERFEGSDRFPTIFQISLSEISAP